MKIAVDNDDEEEEEEGGDYRKRIKVIPFDHVPKHDEHSDSKDSSQHLPRIDSHTHATN